MKFILLTLSALFFLGCENGYVPTDEDLEKCVDIVKEYADDEEINEICQYNNYVHESNLL